MKTGLILPALLLCCVSYACSSDSPSSPGSGGAAGSGGTNSSAGSSGSGTSGSGSDGTPCGDYCACHDQWCASTPIPGGMSCMDFCATFTADQLQCRKTMCVLVEPQPNNDHCSHSVGIQQCL